VPLLPLLLVLALSAPAAAAPAPAHVMTAWTEETGLPPGEVLSIAQDLDGYVWLGTTMGLVRFDGARFVPWGARGEAPLPPRYVTALVGSRDGSLWLGYNGEGGVSRIRGTRLETFAESDGVPAGPVSALMQDREGAIWAAGRGGLARFRDDKWERVYREGEVISVFEDAEGTIWIGTALGVLSLRDGTPQMRDPGARFVQHFAQDSGGVIWTADFRDIVRPLFTTRKLTYAPDVRVPQSGWQLTRDRRGDIWVAALGGGLLRLTGSDPRVVSRVPYEQMLTGAPRTIFLDRDDNLWVGLRPKGLLRLAPQFITTDVPLEGLTNDGVRALLASGDGSVWVGTGYSVHRFSGTQRQTFDVAQTRLLHQDSRGALWVLTTNGLNRIEGGRAVPVKPPLPVRWDRVSTLSTDQPGVLWLCSSQQGLMMWKDGVLSPMTGIPNLTSRNCSYSYADRHGRLWAGFGSDGLAMHEHGTFQSFGVKDGLTRGDVSAILEDRTGAVWVATHNGVSRYRNGRFTALTLANGPFDEVPGMLVEDDEGFLWVGIENGASVVRFDPAQVDRVEADPGYQIEYRMFDITDGMKGEIRPLIRPAGVKAVNGRLWFASGQGVVIFDPANLPPSQRPNRPRVERVFVEGRVVSYGADLALPNGTSILGIEYTTASVSAASKLRFRYRLEGIDTDWVAGKPNRVAVYEHLPPGRYRFRVAATNDGVWTESAAWQFSVALPFYRQTQFLVLAVLAVTLVLGAAWWLRVRALRAQYAMVFEERTRVSREIHDTLLQSLAAIGMELETIASQLGPPAAIAQESLRRLRRQVSHTVRDARDTVWGLRHGRIERSGLVEAIREVAEMITATRHVQVEVSVEGRPRRSSSEVELQLLRIGHEAMSNAVRHGQATHIQVVLSFQADTVALSVSDNGGGFIVDEAVSAEAPGEHLGLLGMRERVERVRGQLRITSSPGQGTIIEVSAPTGGA
jgi:signal transduction histidine kinase